MTDKLSKKTIQDFGRQHQTYSESGGYYVSTDILADVLGPLMNIQSFAGKDILDIGSGTGRWLRIFHELGAKTIAAVEPSPAIEVAKKNTAECENISYHNVTGDKLPAGPYDYVYSYGVIHHIPEPDPVIARAFEVLKPGGHVVLWLYGRENNGPYLFFMRALRLITVPLPDGGLDWLSGIMVPLVRAYSRLSKMLPLPLRGYMQEFIDKVDDYTVKHVIYDQLDPHYAKYYRRQEVIDLLERAGFSDVQVYHRQAYSWTVVGAKPS
jgi:2-polyprenyl-3-methyl-5-hydroxy-6-metoxy-1,4-benzoquinol methylase